MNEQTTLQNLLRTRLDTLRIRYPRYSVRAFAKKAGVSPATLSLVLQGKRKVSKKLAKNLGERLAFDPQENAELLRCFPAKRATEPAPEAYADLRSDQYQLLADWRAFAILSLLRTKGFRNDPAWIGRRLGISAAEARETVDLLIRLGMLSHQGSRLVRTKAKYRTTEDVANISLRASHRQTLELAHEALEGVGVEARDFTWITFAADPAQLKRAKARIRAFQDELLEELEAACPQPSEVYRLAVQLFPLTKIKTGVNP